MWTHDDSCIKCSVCVSACPVFEVDFKFPGPKVLGPDWYRRYQSGDRAFEPHVNDCTFCQLCEAACPVDVPIAHLIAEHKSSHRLGFRERLRDAIFSHPQWLARFPQIAHMPRLFGRLIRMAPSTLWPKPGRTRLPRLPISGHGDTRSQRVGLYVDCFSRGFDEDTVFAAKGLLTLWGFEVVTVPLKSLCCGAAALASGRLDDARANAQRAHQELMGQIGDLDVLVTLNATCDATLRDEWARCWNMSLPVGVSSFVEFAIEYAPQWFWNDLRSQTVDERESVTWVHATCRSKASRGEAPMSDLVRLGGFPLPESVAISCCGAGGSYAFKKEHEATAHALGSLFLDQVGHRAGNLIVDSGPCALHLNQISSVPAKHPAHWLYSRYMTVSQVGGQNELI